MKRSSLLSPLAYLLLTLVMTWPTAAQFTVAIPGDGFDGWQNYWNLWWVKEALLVYRTHPFFTTLLYPPAGTSLLFHTLNFFNGLWSLPLQLNRGLAVAYNAVVLFHFTLAGYGLYLLARYTLARLGFRDGPARWGAFAGGLVFTFSPFHMAHLLGHMQVFSLAWPPFYLLALLRALDTWRTENRLPGRALALSGLFLLLATAVDWYQTLYLLLFTGLALIWALWAARRDRQRPLRELLRPVLGLIVVGGLFGLVSAPLIVPMAREALTADYMKPTFEQNVSLSADLLAFVTPSELHPLWGRWATALAEKFPATTSERLVFAGFVPLGLAILAGLRRRRSRLVQFWLLFTIAFLTLALGPYLHIVGQIVRWGATPLPLPYLLLYKTVPFISISRSLSRFDLMVMMGLGVLAAAGAATLIEGVAGAQARRSRPLAPAAGVGLSLCLLIVFEFLAIPYPMSPVDTPPFYFELAREDGDYVIANLPMNWDRPTPLLYQTTHGKRLLTAYTSRNNPLEQVWRTPVLQQWRFLSDDVIEADLSAIAPTVLADFNVRYVVLDYFQMPPGPERAGTERYVAEALPGVEPVHDDGRLKVYAPPAPVEARPYLSLGVGWGERQTVRQTLVRAVIGEAGLLIHHASGLAPILAVEAFSDRPQTVELSLDGREVATFAVGPAATGQQIQLPVLATDPVTLVLRPQSPAAAVFVSRLALVAQASEEKGQ